MPMALMDHLRAIEMAGQRPGLKVTFIGTKAHGTTKIICGTALLGLIAHCPFGHQADKWDICFTKLAGSGTGQPSQIAGGFQNRHLHAKANPKIGNILFTRKPHRAYFAFRTAFTKPTRHQNTADMVQRFDRGIFLFKYFRVNPFNIDLDAIRNTAMNQRLTKRFIRILQAGIFADNGNRDLAFRIGHGLANSRPSGQIRSCIRQPEMPHHFAIQPLIMVRQRHFVNITDIARKHHRRLADVTKQANFPPLLIGQWVFGTTEQDIRLNTDRLQFLHRMLCRFGFQLSSRGDIGNQRDMQKTG